MMRGRHRPPPPDPSAVITSVSNDKIKFARGLARKKERVAAGQFLLEGTRLVAEAQRAGATPALVFYERSAFDADARLRQLVIALRRETGEVHEVSAQVLRALTDTETPSGIAAVFPIPQPPTPAAPQLTLVLDRLRDPGNLGTILRTAWAADVDSLLLAPETADPFNPKVVRAGMGAHFHVPIQSASWEELAVRLGAIPRVYLAEAQQEASTAAVPYQAADWSRPVALIIGGEAEGASAHALELATATIAIPMPGSAESLNAAVAAGILLFQAVARNNA